VSEDDVLSLERVVSKDEIYETLRVFAKDKRLDPDGWTIEFFLTFFELVGHDLLDMVEEKRIRGEVISSINSTFLALIPKVNSPSSFNNFWPISLCNLCYKIFAKVIRGAGQYCLYHLQKSSWVSLKEDKHLMQLVLHMNVYTVLKIKNFKQ